MNNNKINKNKIKNKIFNFFCKIGIHQWRIVAHGKKRQKRIEIGKCNHCEKDTIRYK